MELYRIYDIENAEYHEDGKLYSKEDALAELQTMFFYDFEAENDAHGHETIDQCSLEEILTGAHYQLHFIKSVA